MKYVLLYPFVLSLVVLTLASPNIFAQGSATEINTISTAVPFLRIPSDARSGAMGDVGIALSPDANAMYWNAAKLANSKKGMGLSISYTPWLRQLVPDIYIANISGFRKISKNQAIGVALSYFDLGTIQFTNSNGQNIGEFNPNEFAATVAYSRVLSEKLSAGLGLKFIYSNLASGMVVDDNQIHAGKSIAADISVFYSNEIKLGNLDGLWSFGTSISNLGSKITYSQSIEKDFIPINLGIGSAMEIELDGFNQLTIAFDINKLLVPTPDQMDSTNAAQRKPVPSGVLGSFTDAPGGFTEELHELMLSTGVEYWYSGQFAIRAGYFYEHKTKGNRQYLTAGLGLKFNVLGLDVSYLIPSNTRNPLDNTLRFTLTFDFEAFKKPTMQLER